MKKFLLIESVVMMISGITFGGLCIAYAGLKDVPATMLHGALSLLSIFMARSKWIQASDEK